MAAGISCVILLSVVAGCALGPGRANPTTKPGYHVLSEGKLSMTVPDGWAIGKQVDITEGKATGGGTFPDFNKSGTDTSLNPENASPFFSEQLSADGENAYLNLWELSAAGNVYSVSVTVPASELATLKRVVSHLTTPPVATATDAVRFEQRDARHDPGHRISTTRVGSQEWLLDAGSPATAMQPFALYHSTDRGRTWRLEAWTHFRGSSDFMGLAGKATIFFWNNEDGLIAESSGFAPMHTLLVYRTTDGGKTWTTRLVSVAGNPDGDSAPAVTEGPGGTLSISGEGAGGAYSITSPDGGATWNATSSAAQATGPLSLWSVAMTGPRHGYGLAIPSFWAATTSIEVTADGGAKWQVVKTIPYRAEDITAPTADTAFLTAQCRTACQGSVVMGSADGGHSWQTLDTSPDELWGISFVSAKDGWVLSGPAKAGAPPSGTAAVGTLLQTTDGGATWTKMPAPCAPQGAGALSFVNGEDGWLSCGGGGAVGMSQKIVYHTTDGGLHWTVAANTGPVTGSGGASPSGLPLVGFVDDLYFETPDSGFIGIDRGGYWTTNDGGKTWTYAWPAIFPVGADNAPSVGMLPSGYGWLLETAANGTTLTSLYTTQDNGKTWTEIFPQ